jgi:hypothetical protein
MSVYDEMVETAKAAQKKWISRNDSALQFTFQLLRNFQDYCNMPSDRLRLLP